MRIYLRERLQFPGVLEYSRKEDFYGGKDEQRIYRDRAHAVRIIFGAGNLIFPVFMGQNAGVNTIPATIGFLITGVGLPLLGVLAICYSGVNLRELAGRIHPAYSIFFCTALYLTIGPFFAAPRTATVAYEIAVAQYLPPEMRSMGLYVFAAVFLSLPGGLRFHRPSWWPVSASS